jgi:hypothetical protein
MSQRFHLSCAVSIALSCLAGIAHAEQFVLVDVSYTHSADTTKDSHFYQKPPAGTPKDWTQPIDYSKGSVHIVLDVKTKPPGDTPTKYQLCFEGTPSYGCTLQSPTYTTIGKVEWDSPFASFWYESTVDWTKGTNQIALILKDTDNNKPAGDPKYMPTDLHVQATLVSAGAKFAPPPAAGSGGAAGASGMSAGAGGAGTGAAAGAGGRAGSAGRAGAGAGASDAGNAAAGSSAANGGGAGGMMASSSAGRSGGSGAGSNAPATPSAGSAGATSNAAGSTSTAGSVGTRMDAQAGSARDDGGCRSAGSGFGGSWALGLFVVALAHRQRCRMRSLA